MERPPEIVLGMPSYGELKVLTFDSLWKTGKAFPWVEFIGIVTGPYVQVGVQDLLEMFLKSNAKWMLRIDTDMAWTVEWFSHFLTAHAAIRDSDSDGGPQFPVIHGGVYPRRRRAEGFCPCVQFQVAGGANAYAAEIFRQYVLGGTRVVARTGGGWQAWNREAAKLAVEACFVKKGLGEDYGACDVVRAHGGRVYGTFPKRGEAELYHVEGTTPISIEDFITSAHALLGADAMKQGGFNGKGTEAGKRVG